MGLRDVFIFLEAKTPPQHLKREKTAELYHVSVRSPGTEAGDGNIKIGDVKVFNPRVPEVTISQNPYSGNEYDSAFGDDEFIPFDVHEDTSTPRVCLSKTLEGAIYTKSAWGIKWGEPAPHDIFIFKPITPIEIVYPSNRPLQKHYGKNDPSMWWVDLTTKSQEVWALKPVKLRLTGLIPQGEVVGANGGS